MPATQQRRTGPAERDARSRGTRLRRVVRNFVRYSNDNLEQAGAADRLAQSSRRTWEIFVRWLFLGGLLWAVVLIALLAFIYSGYP